MDFQRVVVVADMNVKLVMVVVIVVVVKVGGFHLIRSTYRGK